jgi:hypothetical protein
MTHHQSLPHRAKILLLIIITAITAAANSAEVYKTTIRPHWFTDNKQFWYRNDLAGGAREFILVDTEKGIRLPAFDHARVAAWDRCGLAPKSPNVRCRETGRNRNPARGSPLFTAHSTQLPYRRRDVHYFHKSVDHTGPNLLD